MPETTIDRLRRVPVFAILDDAGLEHVARIATEFEAAKGHVLMEKGQAGTGLFVIEEGSVRVDTLSGQHVTIGPGGFVGELSVLADTPRSARVSALTDLKALAISRRDLDDLLEREPRLAVAMLGELALRLAKAMGSEETPPSS